MRSRRAGHGPSHESEPLSTSRRNFLRRAGITGAVAAAFIGTAEVTGLSSAMAAANQRSSKRNNSPDSCPDKCIYTYTPERCGGQCPSGSCCYHQSSTSDCCVNRFNCIAGHCGSNFSVCC